MLTSPGAPPIDLATPPFRVGDRNSLPVEKMSVPIKSGLAQYYRWPDSFDRFAVKDAPPATEGFFRFGCESICYGSYSGRVSSVSSKELLRDALPEAEIKDGIVYLPFYPAQVIANLIHEAYVEEWRSGPMSALTSIYYWLRPALPVNVRRELQKLYLRDWNKLDFPAWPVDCSLDNMMEQLMLLSLRASGESRVPFIWFWPEGFSSSAIMTHDVETQVGLEFCPTLMDVDDAFGIKASLQVIPEERYTVHPELLAEIRRRQFEICVHDLNHDGHLYKDREQFLRRAAKINAYGRQFQAQGFRAAVLYRKQLWYDALQFSYDMSVPNVAHLDPQRGGCCTVMPYFFENGILEMPVTTIQDYSLFNILHDYSISVWKEQANVIMEKHGCMSFIVHPDYVLKPREMGVYKELLAYLNELRSEKNVWITTPGEINRWWRQRSAMRLVESDRIWHIEGEGSERARIAFASEENGRLVVAIANSSQDHSSSSSAKRASIGR